MRWLLAAAAVATATPASKALTDALGRKVAVPARAERIISLAPAITETLFAVGAGDRVVGVTRYCDYPEAAKRLPKVGGFADPDVERVLALKPDLVIATADTTTRSRFDGMVAVGLTLYAINPRDLAGVAAAIRTVGELSAGDGERVAKAFEEKVAAVSAKTAGKPLKRTLFLFSVDPLIAAGPGTFVDEIVSKAGGANIAGHAPTSYPRMGLEAILAADPEAVFVTAPGGKEALTRLLAGTAAAKGGAIQEVDPDLLERPGPRLADGLERVARALHPEAFR